MRGLVDPANAALAAQAGLDAVAGELLADAQQRPVQLLTRTDHPSSLNGLLSGSGSAFGAGRGEGVGATGRGVGATGTGAASRLGLGAGAGTGDAAGGVRGERRSPGNPFARPRVPTRGERPALTTSGETPGVETLRLVGSAPPVRATAKEIEKAAISTTARTDRLRVEKRIRRSRV